MTTENTQPEAERFPHARNSYSCKPCQAGDHANCRLEDVGMSHRYPCTCYATATPAHVEVKRAVRREILAEAIYAEVAAGEWLSTVDGTPNQASYAIADALLAKGLAR